MAWDHVIILSNYTVLGVFFSKLGRLFIFSPFHVQICLVGSQLSHFPPIYPFFKKFENRPKQVKFCFSGAPALAQPDGTGTPSTAVLLATKPG
jgi:hypothetical protein